jgi:Na+-translocating ferredoxin:NAD+ oxidoreductase subunit C
MEVELSRVLREGAGGVRKLWKFTGGIHLPGHKSLSNGQPVRKLATPRRVILPLKQHIGAAAEPVVSVGDSVYKGQLVATAPSFISAPVHASVSGRVIDIGDYAMPHPSGIAEQCIVIESDGEERWSPDITPQLNPEDMPVEQLRELIRNAGIVGLGGAVFPSAAKLSPPREIDTLIINGVECEPYITCDDMLMRSRSEAVIRGTLLLQKIVSAKRCLIAVEDNKPEALSSLQAVLESVAESGSLDLEVVAIPTVFPAGGEKQLVKVLTGREVPEQGLPYEVGAVCLNVGTTAAVYDAVYLGRPLISRLVTVTGPGINKPGNFEVPLGTPVADLLTAAGGVCHEQIELIMGGPMMGYQLPGNQVMIVKGSNCILVQPVAESLPDPMPCIRCGSCTSACPMQLLPQQLYWHARGKRFDKLEHYSLDSCIECGCCAVVCPSNIPLVSYFRFAKSEIADQTLRRQKADESRIRNEARNMRLEAIKREREARKARRKKTGRAAKAPPASPAASTVADSKDASSPSAAGAS